MKSTHLILSGIIVTIMAASAVLFVQQQTTSDNTVSSHTSLPVLVVQGDNEIVIDQENTTVSIERSSFSIQFYNKAYRSESKTFHSAQLAAYLDSTPLDEVQIGMQYNEFHSFAPGTGLAGKKGGYDTLHFNKSHAHHYLFYENEGDRGKTVQLIEQSGENLKLELRVDHFFYSENESEVTVADSNIDQFYLVMIIDRDLDGIIDEGELNKLTIQFKN